MGNKDEKTFTDLFSSSTSEPEPTKKTFSDILNSSSTEKKDAIASPVTFDSLFDKIPSNEPEKPANVTAPNSLEQAEEKNENKDNTDVNSASFNSIFEVEKDAKEQPIDNKAETFKETPKPKQAEQEQNEFNPFFESPKNNAINSESLDIKTNDILSSKKEDKTEISKSTNPFFSDNSTKNENKIEENITTDSSKTEIDFNNNPFINSDSQLAENKEENNLFLEPKVDENPLFTSTTLSETTEKTASEPLLVTPTLNSPSTETKNEESTILKSTSPFFEEEKKSSEENPFFQNQINLIENQVPTGPSSNIDMAKTKHYNVKIVKKKEPLIKFILGVLSYALFIWLLLIGVTLLVYVLDIKIRAAKGDYSSPTFNAYVVLTGSMLPEIQVYDVVVTKKVDASELKEGDVITFASADSRFLGTIITHRIIKKNPPTETQGYTFQTQGDNNNVADSALVPESNIYGKVILKIPKLGYLQEFLASDGGWIIVILIPCLTVISYDIVKLIKGLKRKKYKNIKVQK